MEGVNDNSDFFLFREYKNIVQNLIEKPVCYQLLNSNKPRRNEKNEKHKQVCNWIVQRQI